jgi:N-acetylmuramoyl-L-alanine amidase
MRFGPLIRLGLACLALAAGPEAARAAPQTPVATGEPVAATALELSGDANRTTITLALSRPTEARAFLMEQPDRVVVDLPEVKFHLPANAKQRQGLVASLRHGLLALGRSRIVIDLAQPALARLAPADGPDGAAVLAIELTPADRETFRKAAAASRPAAAPPAAASSAPDPAAHDDRRPVIVLDPGHGGVDPGAIAATGAREKEVVLGFADRLRARLESSGRYRVAMTRDHDVFVALDERVRLGRARKADLFISIHADTIATSRVRGLTVYTGSKQASDAESQSLAERENTADAAAGLDHGETAEAVADILQDLTLRETRGFSHRFARKLVGEIGPVMPLSPKPQRQAGFRVLRAADMPAVLVELGYLSSRKDLDLLTSNEWRDRAANSMAAAIDRFFAPRVASQFSAQASP